MANAQCETPRKSRLRISPQVSEMLESLARADKRRPTDQAEYLIEQAFRAKSHSPAPQSQTQEVAS